MNGQDIKKYINSRETIFCQKVNSKRVKDIHKEFYTLREIYDDEIVIEFDCMNSIRREYLNSFVTNKLNYYGYKYVVYSHKGKSEHIHIYNVIGLNKLNEHLRKQYKKNFIKKMTSVLGLRINECDDSLSYPNSLIALEYAPHHKTKFEKIIIDTNANDMSFINYLDVNILKKSKNQLESKTIVNKIMIDKEQQKDFMWFVNWLMYNELPQGNRDIWLYKNIAIYCYNIGLDLDNVAKRISENDRTAEREIKGWYRWCQSSPEYKIVSINEIKKYCNLHDLDFKGILKNYKQN